MRESRGVKSFEPFRPLSSLPPGTTPWLTPSGSDNILVDPSSEVGARLSFRKGRRKTRGRA